MQSALPNIWRLLARTELIGRRDASSRGFCTVRFVTRSESVYLAATLPVSFLAHQGTRATLRPTTGTAPFNFNFLAKSPAFVSGANGLVDYERETRPTRARQGRKYRQRENESDGKRKISRERRGEGRKLGRRGAKRGAGYGFPRTSSLLHFNFSPFAPAFRSIFRLVLALLELGSIPLTL